MFRSHYKDPPHFQKMCSIFEYVAAIFACALFLILLLTGASEKLVLKTKEKPLDVIYSNTKFEPNRTMNKHVVAIFVMKNFSNKFCS